MLIFDGNACLKLVSPLFLANACLLRRTIHYELGSCLGLYCNAHRPISN